MSVSVNPIANGEIKSYVAESATAVMVNGDTVFTITGGPIQIQSLHSECITANDATASTMQWNSVPTVGSAATISGASASLANATAGSTVLLTPTALSTAPVIVAASAGGAQLGPNLSNRIIVNAGALKLVIGVGSTTGTWKHYIAYTPLAPGAYVS